MNHTIVVGVDGSNTANGALEWAAGNYDGIVHVVHAISPTAELLAAGFQFGSSGRIAEAKRMVETACSNVPDLSHDRVRVHVVEDGPARALVSAAQRYDSDMIVVGSSGHDHLGGLVGANVGQLVHRSDRPLVVVPPRVDSSQDEDRIVVAISGDEGRDLTLVRWALQNCSTGTQLHVVHSVSPGHARGDEIGDEEERIIEKRLGSLVGDTDREVEVTVTSDDPLTALADASTSSRLVVIGSHHSSRVGGFLSGAIAQHLPAMVDCPVVLVPLIADGD